ncbi:hypothetical protein IWQ61_004914 [Dispira simplex]|nr:hypothetical protein IWQ61_004914 [Dispira simplex]
MTNHTTSTLPNAPLSHRVSRNLNISNPLMKSIMKLVSNPYHPTKNPNGIINLGVAENRLLRSDMVRHVRNLVTVEEEHLSYGTDPAGSGRLRQLIAAMINRHFNPATPTKADHITVHNGTTSAVDAFIYTICDPQEGVLIAAPYYGGFDFDCQMRADGVIVPVLMTVQQMFDADEHVRLLKKAYDQATADGIIVRGIIFTNPHNPFGLCHSSTLIEKLLVFANANNLHILFDEIYALSTFDTELQALNNGTDLEETHPPQMDVDTPFRSVLSVEDIAQFIDPSLVHVIHGMSKDFCMNGLRMGYLISPWNPNFIAAIRTVSMFTWFSGTTEQFLVNFFENAGWVDSFLEENRRALAKSYQYVARFLRHHGINYIPSRAGHFMWVDLRPFCQLTSAESQATLAGEQVMLENLLNSGVYIATGLAFHSTEPGWFRLSFSVPQSELDLGLLRFLKVIGKSE